VPLLKKLVKTKFNVEYKSPASYRNLFKYCGMSFHKPEKVVRKKSAKQKREFVLQAKKRLDGTVKRITLSW